MASSEVASMSVEQVSAWLEAVQLSDYCSYVRPAGGAGRERRERAKGARLAQACALSRCPLSSCVCAVCALCVAYAIASVCS